MSGERSCNSSLNSRLLYHIFVRFCSPLRFPYTSVGSCLTCINVGLSDVIFIYMMSLSERCMSLSGLMWVYLMLYSFTWWPCLNVACHCRDWCGFIWCYIHLHDDLVWTLYVIVGIDVGLSDVIFIYMMTLSERCMSLSGRYFAIYLKWRQCSSVSTRFVPILLQFVLSKFQSTTTSLDSLKCAFLLIHQEINFMVVKSH
jgi:hypothetical protein